jgi:hypothetical protein
MQFFMLTPEIKKRIEEIRAYSENEANWYVPGKTQVPGDKPGHVLNSGNIRSVFSWTKMEATKTVHRHLSVSVPKGWPQPLIVWTIAYHFGFSGVRPDDDGVVRKPNPQWGISQDPDHRVIALGEVVKVYEHAGTA